MIAATPPAVLASERELATTLGVSRESWERIEGFVALLFQWQAKINLVSPASLPEVWPRHVLDSLQLLPLLPTGTTAIADLGSGSGFPALPLALATGIPFDLYESNGKKAAFLQEALRRAGAKGKVHIQRLGAAMAKPAHQQNLVITARALAPLSELLTLAEPFFSQGATALFHKGQDLDAELTEAAKYWRIKARKHQSLTDSRAVILEVQEARRA